jgi:hypothetical protein
MSSTVAPIHGTAVAHDVKKTLAMLHCSQGEAIVDLLGRGDSAIATANSSGSRLGKNQRLIVRYALQALTPSGRHYGPGLTLTFRQRLSGSRHA